MTYYWCADFIVSYYELVVALPSDMIYLCFPRITAGHLQSQAAVQNKTR